MKTFTPSAMTHCCPSFFLFHGRAVRFQPIRRKVRRTRRTVPRACRAKRFGPRTQLRHSSSNCPNKVREVKVRPIKNELSSPNFFQIRRTPRTRFAKQMFVQLRTGLTKLRAELSRLDAPSEIGVRTGRTFQVNELFLWTMWKTFVVSLTILRL